MECKKLYLLIALVLHLIRPAAVMAHQVCVSTAFARVNANGSLRVTVTFDVFAYMLNDTSARVEIDPRESLLREPADLFERQLSQAKNRMLHEVVVTTDRGDAIFTSIQFPTVKELDPSMKSGRLALPMEFETELVGQLPPGVQSISFRFPKILDQLFLTVYRPGAKVFTESLERGASSSSVPVLLTASQKIAHVLPKVLLNVFLLIIGFLVVWTFQCLI